MSIINRHLMPVAVHLFFIKDEQLLMLRRHNTGYEDGKLSVVAGHVDSGESIFQAAIREAKEEAGVEIEYSNIEPIGVMHRKSNDERIDFFVVVNSWSGIIKNCEPHKCEELIWVKTDNLPNDVIGYIKKAIINWKNHIWFDIYGW